MKKKLAKKFIKTYFSGKVGMALLTSAIAFSTMVSCSPQSDKLYNEAYSEIENGHFRIAISLLEQSAKLEKNDKKKTKALIEAARISRFEIQDFERAIRLYREVILKSQDSKQRIGAQEAVAEINLENLQNYSQALSELLILEQLNLSSEQKEKVKLRIAQAQFLTGNAATALEYIDSALKNVTQERKYFLKLKSEVLMARQRRDEALLIYEEIRKLDEKYFSDENLYIASSIAFEEKEDYAGALAYLEKYRSKIKDISYLELREKRLKEKVANKPLSRGRRK